MHIAIISSIPTLQTVAALGTIDMALTHLVLKYPEYAEFYRKQSKSGRWVILDNSAFELQHVLGQGLDAEPVLEAAERIEARELICTDVLFDGPATVDATKQFISYVKEHRTRQYSFMAVAQGKTRREWLKCYTELVGIPEVACVGLSKLSVSRCWHKAMSTARLECTREIWDNKKLPVVPLHLLGGSWQLPWELRQQRERALVRSNDSSFAFWYAAQNVAVDFDLGKATRELRGKPELVARQLNATQTLHAIKLVRLLVESVSKPGEHEVRNE